MNFELNDEQNQLHDSVQRVLNQHFSFEKRRELIRAGHWHSPTLMNHLGELGVTGLLISTEHGGLGGRLEDLWPVIKASAAALSLEPLWSSAVMATSAVTLGTARATPAAPLSEPLSELLPRLADGSRLLAWAHDEPGVGTRSGRRTTRAHRSTQGWTLTGTKSTVLHGPLAHFFVVSAHIEAPTGQSRGPALFLVDHKEPSIAPRHFRLVDDTAASELTFNATPALALGDPADALGQEETLLQVSLRGMAALCVDMLGAMEAAYDMTISYLNLRKQFGRVIGQNQALRHRAAEMRVQLELCRSAAVAAVVAADRPEDPHSLREIRQSKLIVGRYARQVCESAIQCHGGIGMTEEFAVGHYLRRVHVADHLLGDSKEQAFRLAQWA